MLSSVLRNAVHPRMVAAKLAARLRSSAGGPRTAAPSHAKPSDPARLAVLIDAENSAPRALRPVLDEIATLGTALVRRAYGDWSSPHLKGWKPVLLRHSTRAVQQFAYTTGKNAADTAMVIDAMDLLYSGRFDGFCLVSSDSDFTGLAARLRESGMTVYGFGERKTPPAFVSACHRFINVENLDSAIDEPGEDKPVSVSGTADDTSTADSGSDENPDAPVEPGTRREPGRGPARFTRSELRADTVLMELLNTAVRAASDETGLANLSDVGKIIRNRRPAFDSRAWGHAKLSGLMAEAGFGLQRHVPSPGAPPVVYVRSDPPS